MAALRTLLLLALSGVCSCDMSGCSYYGLLKYLNLTASDKALEIMRPVKNWTTTTLIQMDMFVYGILDVDEKFQSITSHSWIEMHWMNEFVSWNPADFCGIDSVAIPTTMVWIPNIVIEEDCSDSGSVKQDPVVLLKSDGTMRTTIRQRLTYTCQLNLTLFPFDTQQCNVTFRAMSLDADSIRLRPIRNGTALTKISEMFMITQGEWRLVKMETSTKDIGTDGICWSKLVFTVTLERKPMLYVIILIVPLFYLLFLDLASFFISDHGGEKLGFKVTILLSISVLLLILKDILPSTEENLPMIAQYCASVFTMVWFSVLEAMLMNFLNALDGCCCTMAPCSVDTQVGIQLEDKCHKETPVLEENGNFKPEEICIPSDRRVDLDWLKVILEEVKSARQEVGRHEKDEKKPPCYRKLAKIINYLFFAGYFVTVMIYLVYLRISWIPY